MNDPKLIEAMARAIGCQQIPDKARLWEATAALTALCTLRPDLAAVLRGEAVAVPRDMTMQMMAAAGPVIRAACGLDGGNAIMPDVWDAMLAASPYAKETPDDR